MGFGEGWVENLGFGMCEWEGKKEGDGLRRGGGGGGGCMRIYLGFLDGLCKEGYLYL